MSKARTARLSRRRLTGLAAEDLERRDDHERQRRASAGRRSAPSISRRFAKNIARMVEEGGKALAAYLKPREEGQIAGRPLRRDHRHGQDARPGRRILAVRSRTARSNCSRGSARPISTCGARAAKRMAGEEAAPGRHARPEGQALRRSGMVVEPVLRFRQAGLSAQHPLGRAPGRGRQGARPAHAAEGRVLRQADRQRAVAVELRADQSGAAARDARLERREPRARHAHAGRGHRGRRRRSENPPVRRGEIRGRPQPRDHARQGDLRERPDAAHPVRAVDAERAEDAAADRARPGSTSSTCSTSTRKNPSSSGASIRGSRCS